MSFTLSALSESIGCQLIGDGSLVLCGIATLQTAAANQLSFITNKAYLKWLSQTEAGALIADFETYEEWKSVYCGAWLLSKDPYLAFALVTQQFATLQRVETSADESRIHPSVVIGNNCQIHETVKIHAGCVIGHHVTIGEGCVLWPNVTIYDGTELGVRVMVHSGAVLGSDGFGFANDKGRWVKIMQLGKLVVEDDVDIGANTTIDRGALDDTVIETGVKIDNQVQIGHNVRIGAHSIIAGCVGIAGSTTIGRYCMIGGATGIAGHLQIVDKVNLTGMSMVTGSILQPGTYSSGTGLDINTNWRRNAASFRRLDKLNKKVNKLLQTQTSTE